MIIIIIKMFSGYGELVVYPPVQWIESSQNHCVTPWVAGNQKNLWWFMVEELRGGGPRSWGVDREDLEEPEEFQLSWGAAAMQLEGFGSPVPLQACSRWSSGKDRNGNIPAAWAEAAVQEVQYLLWAAGSAPLPPLNASSPQPAIFWGSGSVLCLYSPVIQPLRKGNSSEMEMTEMSFYISWKKKKGGGEKRSLCWATRCWYKESSLLKWDLTECWCHFT